MPIKISLKWSLFALALLGILVYAIFGWRAHGSDIKVFSIEKQMIGFPVRLQIPSLHIDTVVEQVGLTSVGSMDVPRQPNDTAWFSLGPRPGEIGSAVIDGHSGWKDNRPAIFDSLVSLKVGDKIYVEDNQGATHTFIVQGFGTYAPDQDASGVFSSSDGLAHLNLITCSGYWNDTEQTHSTRLVVFTNLVLN